MARQQSNATRQPAAQQHQGGGTQNRPVVKAAYRLLGMIAWRLTRSGGDQAQSLWLLRGIGARGRQLRSQQERIIMGSRQKVLEVAPFVAFMGDMPTTPAHFQTLTRKYQAQMKSFFAGGAGNATGSRRLQRRTQPAGAAAPAAPPVARTATPISRETAGRTKRARRRSRARGQQQPQQQRQIAAAQ